MKTTFHSLDTERVKGVRLGSDPRFGDIRWSSVKSLWLTSHAAIAIIGGAVTFSPAAVAAGFVTTIVTLCAGHSVGFHRLLVHRSFACPEWLEKTLVYLGTLVGMGGPLAIIRMHDIRDWAQRHEDCHPFYTDTASPWRDALWQLHCEMRLFRPPVFEIEEHVERDRFYRGLQSVWMAAQLPLAALLYMLGGWAFVVWGISVRITVSLLGHWAVGWLAHNRGDMPRSQPDHAVQGRNVPHLGLLTMGEAHHNNHHAFPDSARLGLERGEPDPGWWFIRALVFFGLARSVHVPECVRHVRHPRAETFFLEP